MLHHQFSELVDSLSDQITSYHNNVICTVILQDAHSHNWTERRPFYEVSVCESGTLKGSLHSYNVWQIDAKLLEMLTRFQNLL